MTIANILLIIVVIAVAVIAIMYHIKGKQNAEVEEEIQKDEKLKGEPHESKKDPRFPRGSGAGGGHFHRRHHCLPDQHG